MSRIIIPRKQREIVERFHFYVRAEDPECGFMFDVDEHGTPLNMAPAGRANWEACHDGSLDVVDMGVQTLRRYVWDSAVMLCDCGRKLTLDDPMTNECGHCGRLYNGSAQLLSPREQWGEETGETLADIERPEFPTYIGWDGREHAEF